jgi:hypothetical protein
MLLDLRQISIGHFTYQSSKTETNKTLNGIQASEENKKMGISKGWREETSINRERMLRCGR